MLEKVIILCSFILKYTKNAKAKKLALECSDTDWSFLSKIRLLDLSSNGLEDDDLIPGLTLLTNLENVDLKCNRLTSLPNFFCKFVNLKTIQLEKKTN